MEDDAAKLSTATASYLSRRQQRKLDKMSDNKAQWDAIMEAGEGIDWDCVRRASQEARRQRKDSETLLPDTVLPTITACA